MNYPILRRIAKSVEYQNMYVRSKEMSGIRLFKNDYDFTNIQTLFLSYLEMYHNLYQDLYSKEPLISIDIINDELRTDAYLVWKQKNKTASPKKKDKAIDLQDQGTIFFRGKKKV